MLCVVQVIIQHHDSVVTSSDLGLALHCQYDLGNKTVTNGLDLEVNASKGRYCAQYTYQTNYNKF